MSSSIFPSDFLDLFQQLLSFTVKELELCPWMKSQTFTSMLDELQSELEEVKAASSSHALACELGDLFRDAVLLLSLAARDGLLSSSSLPLREILTKIRRRKPWVEQGQSVSFEEACRIWDEVKSQENCT